MAVAGTSPHNYDDVVAIASSNTVACVFAIANIVAIAVAYGRAADFTTYDRTMSTQPRA